MVTAMSITETHFDFLLNPIEAEVQIGLTVIRPDPCAKDLIAQGASIYTATAKEALAVANLANVGGRDRRPRDLLAHGLPEDIALPRAADGGGHGPRRPDGDRRDVLRVPPPTPGDAYRVDEDDRLDLIANRTYGDPTRFWLIADANTELEARRLLEPGREIGVPGRGES